MGFPRHRRNAMKAELETIRGESGDGSLSPSRLVQWAREHPNSHLYKAFEWDDVKAGHAYRLWQARQIIQEYTVEVVNQPAQKRPARIPFVSVPNLRNGEKKRQGSYLPRSVVEKRPDYRQDVLENQVRLLKAMRKNFGWLTELNKVWAAIDKLELPSKNEAA